MRTTTCTVVCAAILTSAAISQQLRPIVAPPGGSFDGILLSHTSPSVMYARHVRLEDHAPQTIYATTNDGVNWSLILQETDAGVLVGPFVTGSAPELVEVFRGSDLYRSADHGQTWERVLVRTINGDPLTVDNVVIHPREPALRFGRNSQGTWYRSRDSGRTWADLPALHGGMLACAASAPQQVYHYGDGSVSRSQDTGTTWTTVVSNGGAGNADAIVVDNTTPLHLVAVWSDTVAHSRDGGSTWTKRGGVGSASLRTHVMQHPQIPEKWALWDQYLWGSQDNGTTFDVISDELPVIEALDAWGERIAIAGLHDQIRVSDESGGNWSIATGDIRRFSTVSEYDPRRLYAVTDRIWYAAGQNDIAKTTDGGVTWNITSPPAPSIPAPGGRILSLAATRRKPDLLYATTASALVRSTDGGNSWTRVTGLPSAVWTCVTMDPVDDTHLLVGGQQRLMESTNAGQSWIDHSMVLAAPDTVISIKISRVSPLAWIFSAGGGGRRAAVYTTTNAGLSFNIARDMGADQVFPDPTDVNIFLVTVAGRGDGQDRVQISTDAGMSWMPSTLPPALFYLPGRETTTRRWAVTSRSGVYRQQNDQQWYSQHADSTIKVIAIDGLTTSQILMAGVDQLFMFDPDLTVSVRDESVPESELIITTSLGMLEISVPEPMTVSVYDVRGRLVVSTSVTAHAEFELSGHGVYLLRAGDTTRIVSVP